MDDSEIEARLAELRTEHRSLDAKIKTLFEQGKCGPLQLQRLKKRKLALRDEIRRLEDQLLPDIIA